jgi:diguanylate cyclase (GGDEF)-like protein/putative nucleotidyltransferase with HDIG domain
MSLVLSGVPAVEDPHASPRWDRRPFTSLPPTARVYVAAVICVGFGWLAVRGPAMNVPDPAVCIALVLLSAVAVRLGLDLPLTQRGSTISLACAADFAALLILGPDVAMVIAASSAFFQCALRPQSRCLPYGTMFSMAALVISVQLSGLALAALGGAMAPHAPSLLTTQASIAGAASTYLLINVLLVGLGAAGATGAQARRVVNEVLSRSALHYVVGFGIATVSAYLVAGGDSLVALVMATPLIFMYRTCRTHLGQVQNSEVRLQRLFDLHLATIEALARAIEAKDQTSTCHIRRVQVYAAGLARAFGLPEDEVQGVRTAALLHDIGKLAVPEHILAKPGPLTPEEFQKVRIHAQVGAEILEGVPFPYPVTPLILGHHERWDGGGYPKGLKGTDIPLGARILAVADYFDSLRSDRPYHKALPHDAALEKVRQQAGKALDPRIVQLFLERLPEFQEELDLRGSPAPLPSLCGGESRAQPEPAERPATDARRPTTAYEDIALAHREVYALYEIAQAMGTSLGVADTMALIASKLTNLIPFSSSALFLHREENDSLVCRFASGVDEELVRQLVLRNGEGLVGWVGRNLRSLVNARPRADFDAAGISEETALQSALVCPLVFGGRLIGVLAMYHVTPGAFSDDHRRLLDRICEQAAGVVHNSVLYEQTKHDSLTDPLTGLPNTRFMIVHVSRELARAQRLGAEVSLLVLDLDSFKEINDRHGHHVGDRALREVARVLRAETRPYDICVRYAGDEFVVVLSGCGADEAESKRAELQDAIAKLPFEVRPGQPLALGCSCGSASFPRDGAMYETLLSTADKRMYENKSLRKRAASQDQDRPAEAAVKAPSVFAKLPRRPAADQTH